MNGKGIAEANLFPGRAARWISLLIVYMLPISLSPLVVIQHRVLPPPLPNKLGFHLLLDDGRASWPITRWESHLAAAAGLAGPDGWVVQLVRLDDLNSIKWNYFLALCARYRLRPVIRLATTFDPEQGFWRAPPADPDGRYRTTAARYAGFVAALDPAEPPLIIVGNEPNHGDEWGGRPDPAAYAAFLADVAQALSQTRPDALILNGALDLFSPHTNGRPLPNGMTYLDAESFMDGMHRADPKIWSRIDIWASHSYPEGPFTRPPWEQQYRVDYRHGADNPDHQEPPPGVNNRGINGYEWELWKLGTYGVSGLPVMITETGWRHQETTVPAALDNAPRQLPQASRVESYLRQALFGAGNPHAGLSRGWSPLWTDERLVGIIFFALDGHPAAWGHSNWLLLDEDGRVQGSYISILRGH